MDDEEYLTIIREFQELSTQILGERDLEKRKEAQIKMKELTKKAKDYETQVEIEEFLEEMRAAGAISLKDQEIKVHKNGAKITIPQAYLRDGMLSDKKKYTLVFLPNE